jgi:hypothetical protein
MHMFTWKHNLFIFRDFFFFFLALQLKFFLVVCFLGIFFVFVFFIFLFFIFF